MIIEFVVPIIIFLVPLVLCTAFAFSLYFTFSIDEKPKKKAPPENIIRIKPYGDHQPSFALPRKPVAKCSRFKGIVELFKSVYKTEFAILVCDNMDAIDDFKNKMAHINEATLRKKVETILKTMEAVLTDYASIAVLSPEMRRPIRRISIATFDALQAYILYRNMQEAANEQLDRSVIEAVTKTMTDVIDSIATFRIDHQKDALNKLEVELAVLRDASRR